MDLITFALARGIGVVLAPPINLQSIQRANSRKKSLEIRIYRSSAKVRAQKVGKQF